ncbi:hypothetical protein D6851_12320 [Altericroceibacterium spongiae]|uniref:Reverse transcriptase domain-containing protein n=1 Tax=Altericroceibacterium spongiae TaxID=2320269 RepID=A0A420EEX6_9SPHN|nr:reverse transcriptase domain-containing protein [Altericroceibacterium spongiae]RKF19247.1 hypothetical protein D6851_12320 [Altericroceibacterium spongiae]
MKTTDAAPSQPTNISANWRPTSSDQKHYPHFDAPLKLSEIRKIVNDPQKVAQNAFFPLIEYTKSWQPFRTPKSKKKPKKKIRKIRYAARRDAYIYARYRRILSPLYEKRLEKLKITEVPIAYRKIPNLNGKGKCNVDFANDVFEFISHLKNCTVITLDISKFFDSLDHQRIEKIWRSLLNVEKLPNDHLAVFNSITKYRWVDKKKAYERLGYFGKKKSKTGALIDGFLNSYKDMPKQLCKPSVFREKISGKGPVPSIINKNSNAYGIPQGTPISDLIANMYMLDFDCFLKKIATQHGGRSYRYSDDILIVLDTLDIDLANRIEDDIIKSISSFGVEIKINKNKSSIHRFKKNYKDKILCECVRGSGKNGLEYLGFRFDGQKVFLRDLTLANLRRKLTSSAYAFSSKHKKRYASKNQHELTDMFNFDLFFQKFMKVQDFDKNQSVKNWTFWTYARRASETFGSKGSPIFKQLKFFKPDTKRIIEQQLSK